MARTIADLADSDALAGAHVAEAIGYRTVVYRTLASCIAAESCMIAVLSRDSLARIILEQTTLGAKILMELVLMLSQRLRHTSSKLLAYMDREKT